LRTLAWNTTVFLPPEGLTRSSGSDTIAGVKRVPLLRAWHCDAAILLLAAVSFAQMAPTKPAASALPKSAPAASPALAPDEGTIDGQLYTSKYFGFRYTLPDGLLAEEDFLNGQQDEERRSFILLAAYGPSSHPAYRQGLVIAADRNVYPAVKNAADYIAKTAHEHFQSGGFEELNPAHRITLGGHEFSRIDYRKGEIFQSLLATEWRGYLLTFDLVAPGAQDLDKLAESLQSLRFPSPKPRPAAPLPAH